MHTLSRYKNGTSHNRKNGTSHRKNGTSLEGEMLGRLLIDLLCIIQHLEAVGADLYLDQQNIDTTTPMGKLLFQITGAEALCTAASRKPPQPCSATTAGNGPLPSGFARKPRSRSPGMSFGASPRSRARRC
jgi:Resolvase, N terminal domain